MGCYKGIFRRTYLTAMLIVIPVLFAGIAISLVLGYVSLRKLPNRDAWILLAISTTILVAFVWALTAWWLKKDEYFANYALEIAGQTIKVTIRNRPTIMFCIPDDILRIKYIDNEPNIYLRNERGETFSFNPNNLDDCESALTEYNAIISNQ